MNNNKLLVMPLGGLEQIGANCTLIGYKDNWIMVDLGISFCDKLGIEVITPDISFPINLKNHLKGIFITHAHEDHIGAIHYFWSKIKCPIYLTEFSREVLKQKLKNRRLQYNSNRIVLTSPCHPILVDQFTVEFVSLSHSIVGACGLYIKTPGGSVFHTGDWKIDDTPLIGDKVDIERLQEIGNEGIDCLLCDSTNVLVQEDVGSENDVKNTIDRLISKYNEKRITITCFASNVARIDAILGLAKKHNRKVLVIGKSIANMLSAVSETSYLSKSLKANISSLINEQQAASMKPEHVLMICTGSQGENKSALFRLAKGENRTIKLNKDDVVLFSSKVIPGNELCIRSMQNLLAQKEVEIVTLETEDYIHVSGHPNRKALKKMYEWLNPKSLIPLHGDPVMLHAHQKYANECGIKNTIVITSGDLVSIDNDNGYLRKVHHNNVIYNAVDGRYIIPINHNCLRERSVLSQHGYVGLNFIVNTKTNKLINDSININIHGIYISKINLDKIKNNITKVILGLLIKIKDDNKIKEECRKEMIQIINQHCEKKPIIDINFYRF
ncbi:MAG: ribonuclease J [Alphaproteobacteria bacterium]|nr:ribonuclease J [Alphaproteobacteria bacterium]